MIRWLFLLAAPGAAWAHCDTATVCPPDLDPCVVDAHHDIDTGCLLDFGDRHVVIESAGRLDAGAGSMTIQARDLTIERGGDVWAAEGSIDIVLGGDLWCDGNLDLKHADGGGYVDVSAGGRIDLVGGTISAAGTGADGDGGELAFAAAGAVVAHHTVDVHGGRDSSGGTVTLTGSTVEVQGMLDASGGEWDGGTVAITSTGDCILGDYTINLNGGGEGGYGGTLEVTCDGHVTSAALIKADGDSGGGWAGDGGDLAISAGGDLTVSNTVRANGSTPDGYGGIISFTAGGTITVTGPVDAQGLGAESAGGDVELTAGGAVTLDGDVDITGGDSDGGTFTITGADVTVTGPTHVNANGGGVGGWGGSITIDADGHLDMQGDLDARGDLSDGEGGTIDLTGCTVDVAGDLVADRGAGGAITITSHGSMVVSGVVDADALGDVTLVYGEVFPDIPGLFTPDPALVHDPTLIPCDALILHPPDPGAAGVLNTWAVDQGTPGVDVALIVGGPGPGPEVPGCPGTFVDVAFVALVGRDGVAPDGTAAIAKTVPDHIGGTFLFQAVELATCRVSNPVEVTF